MLGLIGGSGLYDLAALRDVRQISLDTPYGAPSDTLVLGTLDGMQLCFLPRHGRGHRLLPSEVPYRANVYALKQLGVKWLVSISAVGSLREELAPGHFVIPSQYIDRTSGRARTFFGEGVVGHVSMAEPACPALSRLVAEVVRGAGVTCHTDKTYVCMEGPAFSTRAESHMYRAWGCDIIGMTAVPEVHLAREAELHYVTLALSTDYDCWRPHDDVDVTAILKILKQNGDNVRRVLSELAPRLAGLEASCKCTEALKYAVVTDPAVISEERRAVLQPLLGKYWGS